MSYDDGSLGRREDKTGSAGDGRGVLGELTGVYDTVRRHLREWPKQYVEMRAGRYDRD